MPARRHRADCKKVNQKYQFRNNIRSIGPRMNDKAIGLCAISILVAISIIHEQPGSAALLAFIVISAAMGKINFRATVGGKKLFSTLGILSLSLLVSVNALNSLFWGLGEIVLNSFAAIIIVNSLKMGKK